MKIVFSKHALIKLEHRGLEKSRILETVEYPDFIQPSYNFREERYRLYTRNHLKVIVKIESTKIIIITAHWVANRKIK
jgi:hypothetical protein